MAITLSHIGKHYKLLPIHNVGDYYKLANNSVFYSPDVKVTSYDLLDTYTTAHHNTTNLTLGSNTFPITDYIGSVGRYVEFDGEIGFFQITDVQPTEVQVDRTFAATVSNVAVRNIDYFYYIFYYETYYDIFNIKVSLVDVEISDYYTALTPTFDVMKEELVVTNSQSHTLGSVVNKGSRIYSIIDLYSTGDYYNGVVLEEVSFDVSDVFYSGDYTMTYDSKSYTDSSDSLFLFNGTSGDYTTATFLNLEPFFDISGRLVTLDFGVSFVTIESMVDIGGGSCTITFLEEVYITNGDVLSSSDEVLSLLCINKLEINDKIDCEISNMLFYIVVEEVTNTYVDYSVIFNVNEIEIESTLLTNSIISTSLGDIKISTYNSSTNILRATNPTILADSETPSFKLTYKNTYIDISNYTTNDYVVSFVYTRHVDSTATGADLSLNYIDQIKTDLLGDNQYHYNFDMTSKYFYTNDISIFGRTYSIDDTLQYIEVVVSSNYIGDIVVGTEFIWNNITIEVVSISSNIITIKVLRGVLDDAISKTFVSNIAIAQVQTPFVVPIIDTFYDDDNCRRLPTQIEIDAHDAYVLSITPAYIDDILVNIKIISVFYPSKIYKLDIGELPIKQIEDVYQGGIYSFGTVFGSVDMKIEYIRPERYMFDSIGADIPKEEGQLYILKNGDDNFDTYRNIVRTNLFRIDNKMIHEVIDIQVFNDLDQSGDPSGSTLIKYTTSDYDVFDTLYGITSGLL
jgi:hypothetical protein